MPDFLKPDCPQVLLSCEICDSHQAKRITTPSPPEAEVIKLARTGWQIWQLRLCRALLGMEAAKSWQPPKLQTNEITRNFQRADSSWGWCSKEAGWNAACWSFSTNSRQLAQTETSPLWALRGGGNNTTSLTDLRDLNYSSNRSSWGNESPWATRTQNTNEQQQPKLAQNSLCPGLLSGHQNHTKWKHRNSDIPCRHLAVEQAELHTAVPDWTAP